jgi:small GTP-binding protein
MTSLTLKIVFIGDSGAGKTVINHKFISGIFKGPSSATIGAIFSCKHYKSPKYKNPIKIQFWDTAGQERFRSIVPMYYRGSSAVILVYDITRKETFTSIVDYWTNLIEKETYWKIYLIGNKIDLEEKRQVSFDEGLQFAQQHGFDFHEISAKEDELESLLSEIVNSICDKIYTTRLPSDKLKLYGITMETPSNEEQTPRCC